MTINFESRRKLFVSCDLKASVVQWQLPT